MTIKQPIYVFLFLLVGCKNAPSEGTSLNQENVSVANEFIDAFYSFNNDNLASILSFAQESQPNILYYQGWAECGHYKVLTRHPVTERNDSLVVCPVTVSDDLMAALHLNINVTDTFHITVVKGQIRSVQTSSNDPDLYYEAKEWVKKNRPEFIEKPCEGIWEGGPTPCECVQGVVKGFGEFVNRIQKL